MLAAGILTGYLIGLTRLGQFLPRLLAVGTVVSFIIALYSAFRSSHLNKDVVDNNTFFLLCLFICAAALGSSISAPPRGALGNMSIDNFARFLPNFDAGHYYQQVLSWPDKTLNAWNSRRPFNAMLNIMEFQMGGSTLLGMILLRVSLAAIALAAFIAALARVVGRSAALSAGYVLLIWTWPYASSMLSEINGITISASGFALLLVALTQKSKKIAYLGLFALVLAYIFRPYNPLMPGLFAFVVMMIMAENWRKGFQEAILVAFAATVLAFMIPKLIYFAYGNSDGTINGNSGYVLLGHARGTDWEEAWKYIHSKAPNLSERELNDLMYEEAMKDIQQDIRPMVKTLIIGGVKALYVTQREFGAALGFSRYNPDSTKKTQEGFLSFLISTPSIWFSSFFMLFSVIVIFLNIKKRRFEVLLCGISLVVFISIAPVIILDGGWRLVATLYPGLAILITAIPISIRYNRQKSRKSIDAKPAQIQNFTYLPMALIGLVLFAIPYPALSRFFARDVKSKSQAIIVDVCNAESSHWTGLNRAVIAPNEMLTWTSYYGIADLSAFLERYGSSLRQVRLENNGFVLLYQPQQGMPDHQVLPRTTGITLRSIPQIRQ